MITAEQELYIFKWLASNNFYQLDNDSNWTYKVYNRTDDEYRLSYNFFSLSKSNIKLYKGNNLIIKYKFNKDLKINITLAKLKRIHETIEIYIKKEKQK